MGARKHPLEIFRENGRTFVSTDETASEQLAAEMRRGVKGAYLERARELDPDRFRPRSMPVAAPAPAAESEGEPPPARGEPAAPKPRRTWKVRPVPANRPGDEVRRAPPLARVGLLAAVLVLIGASTYALGLWPFAPSGVNGDGSRALKNSRLLPDWLNPNERSNEPTGGAAPEGGASDQGKPDQGADAANPTAGAKRPAAEAAANVEYWLLAASEKLTEQGRKDWKQRFGQDKQRVAKALGEEFPGFRIQLCTSDAQQSEALLRIGPAASEDDPALQRALTKVRALGGSFSHAFVKKFKKP